MPKYVEQDGNIFLLDDKNNAKHIPLVVVQNGVQFAFDKNAKTYKPIAQQSEKEAPAPGSAFVSGVKDFAKEAGQKVLSGASKGLQLVGDVLDYPIGAPVRAAIGAAQTGGSPLSALISQYSKSPSEAPTGKEIAAKAGFSTEENQVATLWPKMPKAKDVLGGNNKNEFIEFRYSPAGAAGLAVDIASQGPTNALVKTAANKLVPIVNNFTKGIAASVTGISEKELVEYATNTDKINKIIKEHGDDIPQLVDAARERIGNAIMSKKKGLNADITKAIFSTQEKKGAQIAAEEAKVADLVDSFSKRGLTNDPAEGTLRGAINNLEKMKNQKTIDITEIRNGLIKEKDKLHPQLSADTANEIQSIVNKLDEVAPDKKMDLFDLYSFQKKLQEEAQPHFLSPGQIFYPKDDVARIARSAYKTTRDLLNKSSPEIALANQELQRLHAIEDLFLKRSNVLKMGASPESFLSAGSGVAARPERSLTKLGEWLNTDAPIRLAKEAAAARTFANPPWIPFGTTGLTGTRQNLGQLLVAATASAVSEITNFGHSPTVGLFSAAASSPAALKIYLNANNQIKKQLPQIINTLKSPVTRRLLYGAAKEYDKQEIDGFVNSLQDSIQEGSQEK